MRICKLSAECPLACMKSAETDGLSLRVRAPKFDLLPPITADTRLGLPH